MNKTSALMVLLCGLFLISGCSFGIQNTTQATSTPSFFTPTLGATNTPAPSITHVPPSTTPTTQPITGTATTKLNVRATPALDGEILGVVELDDTVQVLGKDKDGVWYLIAFTGASHGSGWVAAAYVDVKENADAIQIVGGKDEPTSTPLAENSARLLSTVNVRSGPGTNFDSLGTLDAETIVTTTGKNDTGTWIQIQFQDGPGGRGWISAGFIQAGDISNLTVFNDFGTPVVIKTGTPAPTPTPTVVAAVADEDSIQTPVANLLFANSGTGLYTFTSDISSPRGDVEDWVAFTSHQSGTLFFSLDCSGNGALQIEIWQGNNIIQPWGALACGAYDQRLDIQLGQVYYLHLQIVSSNTLTYVSYQLTVRQ